MLRGSHMCCRYAVFRHQHAMRRDWYAPALVYPTGSAPAAGEALGRIARVAGRIHMGNAASCAGPYIHSVRGGFACNSSSSHSIIFLDEDEDVPVNTERSDFGWDEFVVSDASAKRTYLQVMLERKLVPLCGRDGAQVVLEDLGLTEDTGDAYVDHQSWVDLPLNWTESAPDMQFVGEMSNFFKNDRTVILGGNDNDGGKHPLAVVDGGSTRDFIIPTYIDGRCVARKDERGGTWTLYSRRTGMKVRFSFQNPSDGAVRGNVPDLVDLSITDWCDAGCVMCYRGSTVKGSHAKREYLEGLVEAFADNQVFEVAIGGGEATAHPWFDGLVRALHERHVVPNLTTRNIDYLVAHPETVELLGAVAYSVETVDDAKRFADLGWEAHSTMRRFQIVDGMVPKETLREIANIALDEGIHVTLLGYKTTGRGAGWSRRLVDSGWQELWQEDLFGQWTFAIDTTAARQYRADLERLGVAEASYHTQEGAWSCFVDAVAQKMGASSYQHLDALLALDRPETFADTFRSLTIEDGDEVVDVAMPVLRAGERRPAPAGGLLR